MMGNVHMYKMKLFKICDMFLTKIKKHEEVIKNLPPQINLAIGRFRRIASAAIALIHPMPGFGGSSAADVTDLRKYKGADVAEASVRNLLTSKELRVKNKDGEDVLIANPWMKMFDELITKGQYTLSNLNELEKCETMLQLANQKDSVLQTDLKQLQHLIEVLPGLNKGMREGVCHDAINNLKDLVIRMAQEILKIKEETTIQSLCPGHHIVVTLQKGLKVFEATPGVPKLTRDLSTWESQFSKSLSRAELHAVCSSYPSDISVDPANADYPSIQTLRKFTDAAFNCGADAFGALNEAEGPEFLAKAFAWNFIVIEKNAKVGSGFQKW